MLSLISTQIRISNSHYNFSRLNSPLIPGFVFDCDSNRRVKKFERFPILRGSYGFTEARQAFKFERNIVNSWCCGCKQSEGDAELEAEIMGFMAKSEKPAMFPTKDELMKAGRMDLVEAIKKRGGWYSLGWDQENVGDNVEDGMGFEVKEFQRRVESCKETASLRVHYHDSEDGFLSHANSNSNSGKLDSLNLSTPESLDGSLEIGAPVHEDSGIEGILSRLQKQRNSDLGINLGRNGYKANPQRKDKRENRHFESSSGVARTNHGENGSLTPDFRQKGIPSASSGEISPNTEPETWQTWSNRRAGSRHSEFEAAEISFSNNQAEKDEEADDVGTSESTEEHAQVYDRHIEISHNQIRARLQHLESELSNTLCSIRSKQEDTEEVTGSSNDLDQLSDAWELQENECMSARGRLRSIRAKLAILEGKMALAITDAQKMVEMKQDRIDGARKALQLLRTTLIVWTSPASEVLLAGSFDGWTTQSGDFVTTGSIVEIEALSEGTENNARKMEKSKTGIFSVSLKLYPGKYEIKFIVDGIWKTDPLRPVVNNNGYENNLLIVT